jgi:Tat protein translocase TatC
VAVNQSRDRSDGAMDRLIEDVAMPFGEHLEELRRRLLVCIVAVLVVFLGAWFLREQIMAVIERPHVEAMKAHQLDTRLKYAGYLEGLIAQFKACLIAALAVCAPLWLYELWSFIRPGLYRRERRFMLRVVLTSVLCFGAGLLFGYFVFIPVALRFLVALSGANTEPVLMIGPYVSLFFVMTLALGVVFQTPLVMYHLVRWEIVSVEAVQQNRKVAILAAFVLGAVFTPPDPLTQAMMAIPLIMLYDLGALAAAPTRLAMLNFARFAGTVAVVGGAIVAFFLLWSVGHVVVNQGPVTLDSRVLEAGQGAGLRRGQVLRIEEGAVARIELDGGEGGPHVLVAGPARIQAHGRGTLSAYRGRILADNAGGGSRIQVRTRVARATMERGRAEFVVPEPDSLTVNVLRGEVRVRSEGREVTVSAGHSASFRRGGEPLGDSEIENWWRRRLEGVREDAQ